MIYYLVTTEHSYTIGAFLEGYGKALAGRFRVGHYETFLQQGGQLPVQDAVYLFTDLDRLGPADPPSPARARLAELCDRLAEVCGSARVLNHPLRTLPRHALLRTLHERGLNRFSAYRPDAVPQSARYPLILRQESGFEARQMPLARDRTELEARTRAEPYDLAVEFRDTADAGGIYRKYGAFVVGQRIVPRHLFFSRNWQIRNAELDDPALLAEERAYVEENPHAAALLEVCRLAKVGYGRIDYAMLDGRPQVWEINTNPLIAGGPSAEIPARRATHLRFVELFDAALAALER